MDHPDEFDLRYLPVDFYENPFPYYAWLQAESPVWRLPDGAYLLTRYAHVEYVYKNPKIFSSDKKREFGDKFGPSPLLDHHTTSLVFNDPPLHTRVRRLIGGSLTPRAVAQIQPELEMLVDRLLDAMAARGSVDLIGEFAAAIPVEVIGNLLGVPHSERSPLRDWSLAILGALEPRLTPEAADRGNRAVREFAAYLEGLIERRIASGGGGEDLISKLLYGEFEGQRLTRAELVQNCIFLLNAGHETTTNLIGNSLVALAEHPGERRRLLAEPQLIKTAIEEFLRFESPNQLGNRITTESVQLSGVTLPAGTQITVCIGAANRDPEEFVEPQKLDIARSPNRHLAFGSGIHQCAGVGVARLEAATAIGRFLKRFPDYSLSGAPTRGGRVRFRGFLRIPCALHG
ncbi:MAG TPA: cytochrome P450 [Steroidobacteraceae bacterium]|nr:cytochrome P450 [Steroidobacteraceae bacterium]